MSEACTLICSQLENLFVTEGIRSVLLQRMLQVFVVFLVTPQSWEGEQKKHGTRWEPVPTVSKYPASIFATTSFADTLPHKWRVQDPRRERQNALKKKDFTSGLLKNVQLVPYVRVSEFWIPGNVCLWIENWSPEKLYSRNTESWALEFGTQLKASGIPLAIGIQTPSSIDKGWNPVPGIRIPGLSWMPLRGVTTSQI